MRVPRKASQEDCIGLRIWLLPAFLHLRRVSTREEDTGAEWANLVIYLDRLLDLSFAHIIIDEMVPADGARGVLAGHPDRVDCLFMVIVPQQANGVLGQFHRVP